MRKKIVSNSVLKKCCDEAIKTCVPKKYEHLFGVPPSEVPFSNYFITHKSAKKGQSSFRITKSLLDNLLKTSSKIQKQPKLIISIPNNSDEYILTCILTKTKVN